VGPAQDTFLVSGGQVVWTSAFSFRVSAATYYINGVLYESAEQTIALDAADANDDRIDVIAVNTSGTVVKITGTASTPAGEPDTDPSTQLKLAIVTVPEDAASLSGVANTTLYAENAGSGSGEWDWTEVGTTFTLASLTNPHGGTKDIEATAAVDGDYAQGQIGSGTINPNAFTFLVFFIRSKANWTGNRTLQISFRQAGVLIGAAVTLKSGTFGFDASITASYQQIAIPLSAFTIPNGLLANQLRLQTKGGSIGFYIDDITLQAGGLVEPPVEPETKTVGITIDGGGNTIDAGIKADLTIPWNCTVKSWRMLADVAGSAVIDIWKDTYANFPPDDTDSITAAAPPTLSGVAKNEDATLTGWNTLINAGDILRFNVDAETTTLTRLTLQLTVVLR
jgi:hypothetical protein